MSNNNETMINGKFYIISDIKELVFPGKKWKHLPENICKLTELKSLRIRDNSNLISLPQCIVKLKKLKVLDLSGTKLTHLPKNIGELKNLVDIYVADNESLKSLPESISELTNLGELTIKDCKLIKRLPENIGKLTNLKTLVCNNTSITKLPKSFKKLKSDIKIYYNYGLYNRDQLIKKLTPRKVSMNTELFNKNIMITKKISNIPRHKRVYINIPSNVKNNGELRRLYNRNSLTRYMEDRSKGRLHGGNFTRNNIKNLEPQIIVNKNVYLRNIKVRLQNSPLNKLQITVNKIKTNLPSNVSNTEMNNVVREMKQYIINKIFNKLKNSPSNNRVRIMNSMKSRGLMNNSDITVMKKNFNKQ